MYWIHLSDNLFFFSKLLPFYRVSHFQIFSDNGGILQENFQSLQKLPGLILRELLELETKIGFLFLFLFQSSCSMGIMKSFLNSFILLRGVRIIILSTFTAIESREQKVEKD